MLRIRRINNSRRRETEMGSRLNCESIDSLASPLTHPRPSGFCNLRRSTPVGSVETPSLPTLTHCFPRNFTFYVAHPIRSIHEHGI